MGRDGKENPVVDASKKSRFQREDRVRWMVTRERFQLPDMDPPAPERETRIGGIVNDVFKTLDARDRAPLWREITAAWPLLAGERIAQHARPGRIENGALCLLVDSSAWLNDIARYERPRLLAALQSRFGADRIRSLRLLNEPGRTSSP